MDQEWDVHAQFRSLRAVSIDRNRENVCHVLPRYIMRISLLFILFVYVFFLVFFFHRFSFTTHYYIGIPEG